PYYAEVLARVSPARVTLGVLATDARARAVLQLMLSQAADQPPPPAQAAPWGVIATGKGDTLRVLDLPADHQPAAPEPASPPGPPALRHAWLQGMLARRSPKVVVAPRDGLQGALAEIDLLLVLPAQADDLAAASALLRQMGKPALVLVDGPGDTVEAWQDQLQGVDARVLGLSAAAGHWLQDATLLYAVSGKLPERQRAGFARLVAAWKGRNEERFGASMELLARLLARAARESLVRAFPPSGLSQLVSAVELVSDTRACEY